MPVLNDLTLVIPTYNRERFIKRSISYWKDYDVNVLIVDGSKSGITGCFDYASYENIHYHHRPISFFARLKYASELVETKYVSILSDDEFFIPSAIKSCILELGKDKSLVACGGQCVGFRYKNRQVIGHRFYHLLDNYALLNDSPIERMILHMNPYTPSMIYSIMKSEIWKKLIRIISSKVFDVFAISELQFELAACFYGKSKTIQELFWLRSMENIPLRGEKGLDNSKRFYDWWKDEAKVIERNEFLEHMINHLASSNKASNSRLQEGLIEALNIYWERQNRNVSTINSHKTTLFSSIRRTLFKTKSILSSIKLTLKRLLSHEHQISKVFSKLEKQQIKIDSRELNKIIAIVDKFHTA